MPQLTLDNQALAQLELSAYLLQQSTPEYEIDSVPDVFGELYRVWGGSLGINLIGTFYQNLDGFWISQPCHTTERRSCLTDREAIATIVGA